MKKQKDSRPFAERHPRWNIILGLLLLLGLLAIGVFILYLCIKYIGIGIGMFVDWLKDVASKLEAVVISLLHLITISMQVAAKASFIL